MDERRRHEVQFVCQHGAFRSRIAAAYFNATAPDGWSATSAGVTPQSAVSERLRPLLAGTPAEPFIDDEPPREVDQDAAWTITIDADVPGAEAWRIHDAAADASSDTHIRDEIRDRVVNLVRDLRKPRTE